MPSMTTATPKGQPGRPSSIVSLSILRRVSEAGATQGEAAKALGISLGTFKNRLKSDSDFAATWRAGEEKAAERELGTQPRASKYERRLLLNLREDVFGALQAEADRSGLTRHAIAAAAIEARLIAVAALVVAS